MATNNGTKDIYLEIKNMIERGVFAPNERLNQLRLAAELNVSRTPVATALHMLAAEGYLYQKHNSGFYIHRVTLNEVLELLLARASLESIAAYDIAESADDETLEQITKCFRNLEDQKWERDQASRVHFLKVDQQCHKELLESCKNTWVVRMDENIKILENPNALGLLREPGEILEEHRQVLQALRKRDAFAAQTAMLRHILHTRSIVMEAAQNLESRGIDVSQHFLFNPFQLDGAL